MANSIKEYVLGWTFDYSNEELKWCDKVKIRASTSKEACSLYINHVSSVPRTNHMAVLHCKEVK